MTGTTRRILSLLLAGASFAVGTANAETTAIVNDHGSMENLSAEEKTMLATRHEHAEGVPRDYAMAMTLYCAAAASGHADAQYALGWMHAHGRGIARDDRIARYFFDMAARQGHSQAQSMLSHLPAEPSSPPAPCLQTAKSVADDTDAPVPDYPRGRIYDLVHKLAPQYQVDPQLALAIIRVESAFNAQAVSPKNARGLMQLMPDTARRFHVKNAFDPEDNIKGGLAYLQWLLAFFKGNVVLVAAAYNAGERAVENHRGIPPYTETQNYVRKVTALYKKPSHPFRNNYSPVVSSLAK